MIKHLPFEMHRGVEGAHTTQFLGHKLQAKWKMSKEITKKQKIINVKHIFAWKPTDPGTSRLK